jgi:SAM-dependent methyltransferase
LNKPNQPVFLTRSQKQFIQNLLPYFSGCKTILDAGSGSGYLGEALKQQLEATVTSVDIRPKSLKNNPNEQTAAMDVRYLGFGESFDLVLAKDILEHLTNPMAALKQFDLVLKPDGKLFVNVPSPQAPYFWDDHTHIRPYTKCSLNHMLMESGFKVLYMRYLARPTAGASLLRLKGFFDALAEKGYRRGDLVAVAQKTAYTTKSTVKV